jgi:streptogrisin C
VLFEPRMPPKVATAGHCKNDGYSLHGVALNYITQANGGSSDAQWHKTPGLADENKIKTGTDLWRYITSKKPRSEMYIDGQVCHFGRATGYGCGYIRDKNFEPPEPPNINYNDTFILVGQDDTQQGDSGGPWFLENTAYGIHHGSDGSNADRPVFMAQNYLSNLNLLVRTSN